jgi:YVTN family beta-propeller protein
VIDTTTYATAATVATGSYPMTVSMHPYLPIAYAVQRLYEGVVSVIDTTDWTVVDGIEVDRNPRFAAITPDGLTLYTANYDNTISVVDTTLNAHVTSIDIGARPRGLTVSPDGQTLYVTREWGDGVAIVDTDSNTVVDTVNIDPTGHFDRPWGAGLTCDGRTLVVSNARDLNDRNSHQVALIDTSSLSPMLIAMPDGNDDGYPDGAALGLAVCPQFVPTGAFLVPGQQADAGARGADVEYTLALYNYNGLTDSYAVALDSNTWPTALSTAMVGPLEHGSSAEISVTVSIPSDATWYTTDTAVVTASSVASPTVFSDTAVMTTEAYAPPQISVSPQSLTSTQLADEAVTKTLEIANGNAVDLIYNLSSSLGSGVSFVAASTELYGYTVPGARLKVIGLSNDTDVQILDLSTGSIIDQNNDLDQYETWDVYPSSGTYFKVESNQTVVAVESDFDYCCYTSFIPSIDMGSVGKEFVYYHRQSSTQVYVFAVEDATVEVLNSSGGVVDSTELSAGEYWDIDPSTGVYRVVSTGRIAIEIVGGNGYSTVPAASGQGAGRLFYFATHGWRTGAIAVFAYENADIDVYDIDTGSKLYNSHIDAGEQWWQTGVGYRRLRLESTGDVEVWAGDTEGGYSIEDLGDDISFAAGRSGREYYVHSLKEGFVIFALLDDTLVSVDGTSHTLDKDEYLHFSDCCDLHHVNSSQPILVQTLGRDSSWNDVATYLGGIVPYAGGRSSWLTTDPLTGTVPSDSSMDIDVLLDANGLQPGEHTANLIVSSNDPNSPFIAIPVTMTVEPTANMGRVSGSVTDAWTGDPLLAKVDLVGVHTMLAEADYTIWAPAGTYTLTASASGYADAKLPVIITAGSQTIQDIALEPAQARMDHSPDSIDVEVIKGTSGSTTLAIANTGPVTLEATFHEMLPLDQLMADLPANLTGRNILYDRAHGEPSSTYYSTMIDDLISAGATLTENLDPITAGLLDGDDVLWINCCGNTGWTFGELNALADWLDEGGAILIHGRDSDATEGPASIYEIAYNSGSCSYGTTTNIEHHPVTAGVSQIQVNTCRFLTFSSGTEIAIYDTANQPHVVARQQDGGKMVVVAGPDFENSRITEADNRTLASNVVSWLAKPGYQDVPWLSVDPISITVEGHGARDVTVHYDADNLGPGTYEAILAIEHNDPNMISPVRVPLTLVVKSKVYLPFVVNPN